MLFLSLFQGMVDNLQPAVKMDCCAKSAKAKSCSAEKKHQKSDNCNKPYCNMMLSCSSCGFLAVERLQISVKLFYKIEKPVTPYKIGQLADYNSPGWQPPEA